MGGLPLSRTLHRQKRRWKRKWHGWKQSVRIMTGVLDNNRRRPFQGAAPVVIYLMELISIISQFAIFIFDSRQLSRALAV